MYELVFLVFVLDVCYLCFGFHLRKSEENSMCPGFNLRAPPRVGANMHVCITAFYLRC